MSPGGEYGIAADRVHRVNEMIGDGSPALWAEVQARIADAVERGWLPPGDAWPDGDGDADAEPIADADQA